MIRFLLAAAIVALPVQAQENNFMFTRDGFTDFVLTTCEGKSQTELYNKALQWANTTFTNEKDVILTKENNSITIRTTSKKLVCLNASGKSCTLANYSIELDFKDGRYKFDVGNNIDYLHNGDWKKLNLNKTTIYYNNIGQIKSDYKFFPEIAEYFDALNAQLKSFITKL